MSKVPPFLAWWIETRLSSYREKPRKGTPKGQQYGIIKRKYHAALLHIAYNRAFNLQAIAREAGVSHSVLLNWRREDRFKEIVQQAIREYSVRVVDYVTQKWYDLPADRLFVREELSKYSMLVINAISQELLSAFDQYERKFAEEPSEMLQEQAVRALQFGKRLAEARVGAWGNRQAKITLLEQQAKISSAFAEMQRVLLKDIVEKEGGLPAQVALAALCEFAKDHIRHRKNLEIELVKKGLDGRITGAPQTTQGRKV